MKGATMAGKKTGKFPPVAKNVTDEKARFIRGSLVEVSGREGVFRVVSTSTMSSTATRAASRTVKCYQEPDGRFEAISESLMSVHLKEVQ